MLHHRFKKKSELIKPFEHVLKGKSFVTKPKTRPLLSVPVMFWTLTGHMTGAVHVN